MKYHSLTTREPKCGKSIREQVNETHLIAFRHNTFQPQRVTSIHACVSHLHRHKRTNFVQWGKRIVPFIIELRWNTRQKNSRKLLPSSELPQPLHPPDPSVYPRKTNGYDNDDYDDDGGETSFSRFFPKARVACVSVLNIFPCCMKLDYAVCNTVTWNNNNPE